MTNRQDAWKEWQNTPPYQYGHGAAAQADAWANLAGDFLALGRPIDALRVATLPDWEVSAKTGENCRTVKTWEADRDNRFIAAFMEGSPGPGGRMWENAKKHRAGQPCGDPLCGNPSCKGAERCVNCLRAECMCIPKGPYKPLPHEKGADKVTP